MERIDVPSHIPNEIQEICYKFLNQCVVTSEERVPYFEVVRHQLALKNLILEDVIMPDIWADLDKNRAVWRFYNRLSNDVFLWGAVDKTSPSEQRKCYKRTKNQLSKLVELTGESSEVRFATQMFFEEAFSHLLKKEHYSNISYVHGGTSKGLEYLQFSELLLEMVQVFENYEESFMSNKRELDSVIPRKKNEPSSYRTYLVRCVSEIVRDIYGKRMHSKVADIVYVMLPEYEPLTEDHVFKLLA